MKITVIKNNAMGYYEADDATNIYEESLDTSPSFYPENGFRGIRM